LRQLAEGFLSLSLAGVTAGEPPSSAPARSAGPASTPRPSIVQAPDPSRIYSNQDRSVLPPIEITRRVPPGVEIGPGESPRLYQGLIEVVIDETGHVQSAGVRRSVTATYDATLLEATREWRFEPATLDGTPVTYKKFFEVIVWGMSTRGTFGRR
jgi:TonB family protein